MLKKIFIFLMVFGFFASWQYFCTTSEYLWIILPPPLKIFSTLYMRADRILFHALATTGEIVGALCFAIFASFPLVWTMVRFRSFGASVQTFFILFQSIPAFCLAPLLVMWFGWSYIVIILPTALMMLFPLTLSIYKGFYATPLASLEYFQLHKATSLQTFLKLRLPYALPYFFSGLRISLAISGMGAIAGEWAGAQRGLGVLMIESRQSMELEMTFAALFAVIAITLSLYLFGIFCERRCWSMYKMLLKMSPKPFLQMAIFSVLIVFSLASCKGKKEEVQSSSGSKIQPLHLMLDWLPNPNHVPLYAGKKMKFFEEEGFDLHLTKAVSMDPLQPLSARQVDLVISYFPRTLCACIKGAQMKVVGKLIKEPLDCFLVLEESSIKTPADFVGKTIGISESHFTAGFLNTIFLNAFHSVPKKQNVNFELSSALLTKQVDIIYGAFWNIEPEQISSLGKSVRSFTITEFGVPQYDELVIVAQNSSEFSKPEMAAKFQRALQKSINYSLQNPDHAFDLYFEANPDKGESARIWEERAWKKTMPVLAREQAFSSEQLQTLIRWLCDNKIIEEVVDEKQFILSIEN